MQKNNWIKKIFTPAILLLNRLKYISKFLFISLFFILPLFIATYFLVSGLNHNINFAKKERLGVQYILPVRKFLQNIQQHRGMMSAYLNGDQSFAPKIADKQKEILMNVKEIDTAEAKFGVSLETTNKWTKLKRQWEVVRLTAIKGAPRQSFELHSELAQQVIVFIAHIGDTSNLILDPDLDTYYLMDAFVNNIPFISERLGQIRALGLTLAPEKEIQVADKRMIESYMALTKTSFQKMNSGMDVAFRFNPSIKGSIQLYIGRTTRSLDSFFEFIDTNIIKAEVNKAEVNRIKPVEYYDQATRTINNMFSLYDGLSPVLDGLLKVRIDNFVFQKNSILELILAMFILISYLFAGFYFSIKKTISELGEISDRLIRGEGGEKIKLTTKDELGKIGDLFADVGNILVNTNKALGEDMAETKKTEARLKERSEELERMNDFMVGRELKMAELKKEIKELKANGGVEKQS